MAARTATGDTTTRGRAAEWWSTAGIVYGLWLAMLLAAFYFVTRYGSNVPSWDGWDMVPSLTGHQPITFDWLWSQHNEHRVPMPRLLLLGLHALTGVNFRTPMYFNVLAVGAVTLAMIRVAQRLRGQVRLADAFFPLILLHWGQAANWIWGWQLQYYASSVLSAVVLLLIVRLRDFSRRSAVGIGVCLVLLPLCGANGLALVPVLALWLGYAAYGHGPRAIGPGKRWESRGLIGLAAAALLLCAAYMIGWERLPNVGVKIGAQTVVTAAKALTSGFGPGIVGQDLTLWPASFWRVPCVLLPAFLVYSMVILVRVFRDQPQERWRASGMLAFILAMGCLALALGTSRNGFETRYVTLIAPTWCCVYFVFSLYGRVAPSSVGCPLLVLLALLTLWPNTRFGVAYGAHLRGVLGEFEADMTAGVPSHRLIHRYWRYLHPHQDLLSEYLPMLRDARVGGFRYLRSDPALRVISVPLRPKNLNQVLWEQQTVIPTGDQPSLVFALPEGKRVCGIRLTYRSRRFPSQKAVSPVLNIYWRATPREEFAVPRFADYWATGDHANWRHGTWGRRMDRESTCVWWIEDTVREIQIQPVFPGVRSVALTIDALDLLVAVPADVHKDAAATDKSSRTLVPSWETD